MSNIVLGIDLGTTFSAISYVNKYGKAEIIPNREGERITPSVVLFKEEEPIVGSIAKRNSISSPLDTVQFVKRQIGNPNYNFETEEGDEYTAEEISAIILKRLKEDAEQHLGEKIYDAVITVPAYFNDAQRKATEDAGKIAELNVLRLINEPTAAAIAYGLEKTAMGQTVLVYDLGGGTFDVTIMKISKNGIEVIATDGDKNLGGFDWDNEIIEYLNQEFKNQWDIDLSEEPELAQDLRDKAEIAKKSLSSRKKTKVFLSAKGKSAEIKLTLEKFQEITERCLQKTETIMELVLEDAKLTWSDIDKVLLVGGSTRMKAVPQLIERITGKKPSLELNPDEAVAIGAAIQGKLLQIENGKSDLVELGKSSDLVELSKFKVQDVNSHSMGIIAVKGINYDQEYNSIVLEKNTPIPTKVSETFCTVVDQQRELDVQVTEGESEDIKDVQIVGRALMKIPPHPKNSPIEFSFSYDASGIIHVKVYDLATLFKKKFLGEIKIERKSNLNQEQVENKTQKIRKLSVS